jgi:NAD+ kinase
MPTPFRHIILYGKRHREQQITSTLSQLLKLLEKWGAKVMVESETAAVLKDKSIKAVKESAFKQQGDLIIVVGGDGSMLSAARVAAEQGLPVLGINRGRLGFLADIRPDEINSIREILQGKFREEKRFLLKAEVVRGSKIVHQQIGLNEAVLLPGDVAHMIEFSILIDDESVCLQRADGLIAATPTGSTAYALSGGGPILHPQLDAIALVPMFPHKLTSRPIVVSGRSEIKIMIDKDNETSPCLSCDGQERLPIAPGDCVRITKFKQQLRLIHPLSYQYFATLRSKLQWENKPY